MLDGGVCKLYIIHAWQYGEEYDDLINLLKDPYFKYYNCSGVKELVNEFPTTSSTDSEIKEFCRQKMEPAQIVIILTSKFYEFTGPVKVELEVAKELNKPIISIYSQKHNDIPKEIADISKAVVQWQSSDIISAIRDNMIYNERS